MIRVFYYIGFLLIALHFFLVNNQPELPSSVNYLLVVPAAILVWTAARHIGLRFTKLTVQGNKLRYESGILSKTTRSMELSKVQDVSVAQTLGQRLLGVGDLVVQTAGDSAPLAMKNVDKPQAVADYILEAARG